MSTQPFPFHCDEHRLFDHACIPCYHAKTAYWQERVVGLKAQPVLVKPSPSDERKPIPTAPTDTRPEKGLPVAVARLTDPEPSHLAAAKMPSKKLWERMITIRNLVLANPGQCIRWYSNTLAEQIPAPELDAPGCRDSVGAPRHDVGFYGVWATLFAQAEKRGLIIKVTDPLTPTEKLMQKSPYPAESMVHIYEGCTSTNMQRMETERKAYFERLQAQNVADRETNAAKVAQQRRAKKIATPDKSGFDPLSTAESGQRA